MQADTWRICNIRHTKGRIMLQLKNRWAMFWRTMTMPMEAEPRGKSLRRRGACPASGTIILQLAHNKRRRKGNGGRAKALRSWSLGKYSSCASGPGASCVFVRCQCGRSQTLSSIALPERRVMASSARFLAHDFEGMQVDPRAGLTFVCNGVVLQPTIQRRICSAGVILDPQG
jgi:hypothetical protein